MQALDDGRRRQQGIARALMATHSNKPAPAILDGAVPRVLTDEGVIQDPRDGSTIAQAEPQDDALQRAKMRVLALANELVGSSPGAIPTDASVANPSPAPAPSPSASVSAATSRNGLS